MKSHILILHERTFIQVLETRRMVGRGRPLLPEILGQNDRFEAKTSIFNRYSLYIRVENNAWWRASPCARTFG